MRNSPLNRFIYKQLLTVRQQYNIDIPILTLLNEVYYQCVHIQNDRTPGEDIEKRFLEEGVEWLGSRDATMVVFVIAWALFLRKRNLTFHEDVFLLYTSRGFGVHGRELEKEIEADKVVERYKKHIAGLEEQLRQQRVDYEKGLERNTRYFNIFSSCVKKSLIFARFYKDTL